MCYLIFVVLTCNSLAIAILADGWENSSLLLERRREQKRELRELEKVRIVTQAPLLDPIRS